MVEPISASRAYLAGSGRDSGRQGSQLRASGPTRRCRARSPAGRPLPGPTARRHHPALAPGGDCPGADCAAPRIPRRHGATQSTGGGRHRILRQWRDRSGQIRLAAMIRAGPAAKSGGGLLQYRQRLPCRPLPGKSLRLPAGAGTQVGAQAIVHTQSQHLSVNAVL